MIAAAFFAVIAWVLVVASITFCGIAKWLEPTDDDSDCGV